jgi:putative membrane protein
MQSSISGGNGLWGPVLCIGSAVPRAPSRAGSPALELGAPHTLCTQKEIGMWGDMGYGWGWSMGIHMISMVLFWVLIILGIVVLVRWIGTPSPSGAPPARTALDILKERYARGEIEKQEFEEKKRDLSS